MKAMGFDKMDTNHASPAVHHSMKYNKINKKRFLENTTSDESI